MNNKIKLYVSKEENISKEKYQAIRKQVCDEIRNLAHNYFELVICDNCGNPIDDDCYMSSTDFCKILEQVEKVEE